MFHHCGIIHKFPIQENILSKKTHSRKVLTLKLKLTNPLATPVLLEPPPPATNICLNE